MLEVQHYVEEFPSKHWVQRHFTADIYKNVFDEKFFNLLKRSVLQVLDSKTLTFQTSGTTFNFEGESKKVISHKQNGREQQVIYDMTFDREWWHQTTDTVKDWSNEYLRKNINPIFYKYLHFFESQPPFSDEPGAWIPFRFHINVLTYNKFLMVHLDMNDQYFNTKGSEDARAKSLTFYLDNHVEGHGGEFWTDTGFVFKPKKNHAILINGNEVLHGVCANMNPDGSPRLAFSVRWAHKDDLYLPGHPSKAMYKLYWDEDESSN